MYAENKIKVKEILNSIDDLFIRTGIELIHIKQINKIINTYYFQHNDCLLYSEIHLKINGSLYSSNCDKINQENINTAYITLDTAEVIYVNEKNIAVLLLDECRLVRHAASEWYKQNKRAS